MFQRWQDLLFAHWPVPVESLRPLIPPGLPLDTFDHQAWIGVVPFRMSHIHLRHLPPLPGVSAFPELNVRTYVSLDDRPGVWFFSLDATNPIAVAVARSTFHLPYFHAKMSLGFDTGTAGAVIYSCQRAPCAQFNACYHPTGPEYRSSRGTLEHWLTERYCLYTTDSRGNLYRAEIHHMPWPLQPAEAEIQTNSMAAAAGVELPAMQPLLHFAQRLDVMVWNLVRL